MRVGVATAEITPPLGVKMGGFAARYKGSEGVHDPLYTKALYIADEEEVLLIANDLLNIPDSLTEEVRKEIAKRVGLREESIMISATHTHSGPSVPPDISADMLGVSLNGYLEFLRERIVKVVLKSMERVKVAKLGLGVGRTIVSFNRRVFGGPVDPDVNTVFIFDESGRPFASLVNYACHGVVLGDSNYLISADYPGAVTRFIESRFGPDHTSLFMNGATGDLNPLSSAGYTCPGTFEDVEAVGRLVAYAALNAMRALEIREEPQIRSVERSVSLPLVKPSEAFALRLVENQEKLLSELKNRGSSSEELMRNEAILGYYRKNLEIISKSKPEDRVEANLQAIRVGDAVLVAIPGEPLVEVGLRIKERSPFKLTFIVSYANGYHGYIATSEAYEQGGYEVTPAWWNRLARGAAEIIIEKSLSLMNELR